MKNVYCNLTYALDSEGKLVNIKQVESGIKCNCICPACQESLVAKKGEIRKYHFAHFSGKNCKHAIESMLHHLAKDKFQEAFYKNEEFIIQYEHKSYCSKKKECKNNTKQNCCEIKTIKINLKDDYDTCEQEQVYNKNNRRSDLKIYSSTNPDLEPIYLEFCVTHASDSEKLHSGNKIIEILIEKEDDIFDIIENGIIETKSNNKEELNKISFYGFEKKDFCADILCKDFFADYMEEDWDAEEMEDSCMENLNKDFSVDNLYQKRGLVRFKLFDNGIMECKEYKTDSKQSIKHEDDSIYDICFYVDNPMQERGKIYNRMKYICYDKFKIKNCELCENYVDTFKGNKKNCSILDIEISEKGTVCARSCKNFQVDDETMNKRIKEGIEEYRFDVLFCKQQLKEQPKLNFD
jgi:hypothetical protein